MRLPWPAARITTERGMRPLPGDDCAGLYRRQCRVLPGWLRWLAAPKCRELSASPWPQLRDRFQLLVEHCQLGLDRPYLLVLRARPKGLFGGLLRFEHLGLVEVRGAH